jgi:hypothetical protein
MKPTTNTTATGSLKPASPSSVRASLRRSVDSRSRAKMAAPSVDEMIAPSSIPSSVDRSNSQAAAKPQITAVPSVPRIASDSDGRSTGRISSKPAVMPPSNRMSASATIPIVRASS